MLLSSLHKLKFLRFVLVSIKRFYFTRSGAWIFTRAANFR